VNWFEFEDESERWAYIQANAPAPVWDKDSHCAQMNEIHNALFKQTLIDYNYIDIGELALWLDDLEFGTEAQQIMDWWKHTCILIKGYCDSVTEQTHNDNYVSTLPQVDVNGQHYSWVVEQPTGDIDGVNNLFESSAPFNPDLLTVTLNGLTQKKVTDYITTGTNQIQFTYSPEAGSTILIYFRKTI
jgi:hypothetical protein